MPLFSPVVEYMTPDPVTVRVGDPLTDAAVLMDSMHFRHLPVVREGVVVGVVTIDSVIEEALRARGLPSAVTVERVRLAPPVWLEPNSRIVDAARLMASSGVDVVLVGSQGSLRGILTSRDVLRALVGEDVGLPAGRLMDEGIPTASPGSTVRTALEQMAWSGYRHVLVTSAEGVVLGVFSVRDGLSMIVSRGSAALDASLAEAVTGHVYAIDPGAPGSEVVQAMAERDIGVLPVVAAGRLLGAVTEWGLVKLVASRLGGGGTS